MNKNVLLIPVIALSVITLSGCTSPDENNGIVSTPGATITTGPEETIESDLSNYTVSANWGSAPAVRIFRQGNINKLLVNDIIYGTGITEVKEGDTVTVQYTGIGATTGIEFDSSWTNGGTPITFSLDQVIEGWQVGMLGMTEGSRRLIVIPASMAYGDNPPSEKIQKGESLVFAVDLISIKPAE